MRGEEAPPPRGGRHPPLAVWALVILTVRVVWHSFQVARRAGSGRGPLGPWSASGGFVGVVVGRAQYVQAECYRGVRSRHTAVWRGAVHPRMVHGHFLHIDALYVNRANASRFCFFWSCQSGCEGARGGGRCNLHMVV